MQSFHVGEGGRFAAETKDNAESISKERATGKLFIRLNGRWGIAALNDAEEPEGL